MPVLKKCLLCKKEFAVKPSWVKNGHGKYCSAHCQYISARTGKEVGCFVCGKKVYRSGKSLRGSKSKKFFCTRSCQTKWRNAYFSGTKHANWIHGRASYRTVLLRENISRVCRRCGIDDVRVLAVHHIDRNKNNNKPANLMWLCHNCHHLIHHDKVEELKLMVPIV